MYTPSLQRLLCGQRNVELMREENLRSIEAHLTEVAKLAASCNLTREDVITMYDVLSGEDEP